MMAELETPVKEPTNGCESMSLWKLYLLAVSSLGLYLPFWVYRRAKLNGEGAELESTPAWWGFGTFVTPVCCAILYDFSSKAKSASGRQCGAFRLAIPSLLLAAILLVAFLLSPGYLMVTLFFLLPVPFLIVQHRINESCSRSLELGDVRSFRMRVRHWILVILGLPAVLTLWWIFDPSTYATWMARSLPEGSVVAGVSGLYQLESPGRGWKRVRSGTVAPDEADLEIVGQGNMTWIIANRWEKGAMGLQEAIDWRRGIIFSMGRPLELREERFFLEGSDLVPASLAHYRVDSLGREDYYVLTALLDSGLIEVVGYSAEPDLYSEELREFVTSFREVVAENEP